MKLPLYLSILLGTALCSVLPLSVTAQTPEKKDDKQQPPSEVFNEEDVLEFVPWEVTAGISVGGSKDIAYFRDCLLKGGIPHPNVLSIEGLLSEHDLPVTAKRRPKQLIAMSTEAAECRLPVLPEARYLAQIGMSSSLDLSKWEPGPIHYVAVVDVSGSMNGLPLDMAKVALRELIEQVRPQDYFSLVTFSEKADVVIVPSKVSREGRSGLIATIDNLQATNGTCQQCGLETGYKVARQRPARFTGNSRVMLFTDERPNIGVANETGLMAILRTAAKEGIGTSIFGVGEEFNAEMATEVASVRGANLHYLSDVPAIERLFREELATFTTEMAHSFSLTVHPAAGMKLVGVFGIPGQALEWVGENSVRLRVESLFLSRRQGGIFFALARTDSPYLPERKTGTESLVIATAELEYVTAEQNKTERQSVEFVTLSREKMGTGLSRGEFLIDEYLTLKEATSAHYLRNDQEAAWQLVTALMNRAMQNRDSSLAKERDLITYTEQAFALLSGHQGESAHAVRSDASRGKEKSALSPLCGIWKCLNDHQEGWQKMIIWPNGTIDLIDSDKSENIYRSNTYKLPVNQSMQGKLKSADDGDRLYYELDGDTLHLTYTQTSKSYDFVRCEYQNAEQVEVLKKDSITGLPVKRGS
ncbi:MAG: VWA domain-containing protein [Verrucomicrobiota bacterium]|nr:VWA domain-containing protein [Verrucomicrobiota bacterium]